MRRSLESLKAQLCDRFIELSGILGATARRDMVGAGIAGGATARRIVGDSDTLEAQPCVVK